MDIELIDSALSLAKNCKFIADVRKISIDKIGDIDELQVEMDYKVSIPSRLKSCERKPEDVKELETIHFYFDEYFPNSAPKFTLRKDFCRNFPHISGSYRGCLVPCIYEGGRELLYFEQGIKVIFYKIYSWLQKAAADNLIDAEQGWESRLNLVRSGDIVIADADSLCDIADKQKGINFLKTSCLAWNSNDSILIKVSEEKIDLTSDSTSILFSNMCKTSSSHFYYSLAIPIYCQNLTDEIKKENQIYRNEMIKSVYDLLLLSIRHGFVTEFLNVLNDIEKHLANYEDDANVRILFIFLIDRHCKIIGSDSTIELSPYIVQANIKDLAQGKWELANINYANQIDEVTPHLLSKMSGKPSHIQSLPWTLIGAGSLGSKVSIHLARSGNAPDIVIDKSFMLPHNLARHSLFESSSKKTEALSKAINCLGQEAKCYDIDVLDVLKSKEKIKEYKIDNSRLIINTTASFKIKNALHRSQKIHSQIADASLYANGRIGLLLVEGQDRNPRLSDLTSEFYKIACDNDDLGEVIFTTQDAEGRQMIGQGCGSYTVIMSDGRLSMLAAGMSEYLLDNFNSIISSGSKGRILIGKLCNDDNISIKWQEYLIPNIEVMKVKVLNSSSTWELRIHERAFKKIEEECKKYPDVETGGILLGTITSSLRTSNIIDVIELPEDSRRTSDKLIIGTQYAKSNEYYVQKTQDNIRFLGTWHSHLHSCPASQIDIDTLNKIAISEQCPSISLIHRPDGYEALVAIPQFNTGD